MALMDKIRHAPGRATTGAYILHAGLEKLKADEGTAKGLHSMASTVFPQLEQVPPATFARGLAIGEITLGSALLAPVVPATVAGLGLSAFAGGLLALYAKVPGLRQEGSIWPTADGMAVSKDVWMLGIGLSLLAGGMASRHRDRKAEKAAARGEG